MKIAGKKLSALHEEILVLPRSGIDAEGNEIKDLVFKFKPIMDMDHFNKVCPEPKPTSFITRPGEKESRPDFGDPSYRKALADRSSKIPLYITICSIMATPELEFETVDLDRPETWENFPKELAEAGLSPIEIQHVYAAALKVNALDDSAIEAAKQRFLVSQRRPALSQ